MLKKGICINTCEDNYEYIEINKIDLFILTNIVKLGEVARKNQNLLSKILEYEKLNNKYIEKIAIRKDSLLGDYILKLPKDKVLNFDDIVTFEKITNALNVAVFESNPIAKKLIVPFMKQSCGNKESLIEEYGEEVINYILSNSDFKTYIQKLNGTYLPQKYYVYEDNEITNRTLTDKENAKIR